MRKHRDVQRVLVEGSRERANMSGTRCRAIGALLAAPMSVMPGVAVRSSRHYDDIAQAIDDLLL